MCGIPSKIRGEGDLVKKQEMAATIEALQRENKKLATDNMILADELEKLSDKIAGMQVMIKNRDEMIVKFKRYI